MEILNEYVIVVVMAACVAVGALIKHSLTFIPNKYIPLILGLLGIVFNIWNQERFDFLTLLGGLASGLSATGAFELFKQLTKGKTGE